MKFIKLTDSHYIDLETIAEVNFDKINNTLVLETTNGELIEINKSHVTGGKVGIRKVWNMLIELLKPFPGKHVQD